MQRPKSRGHDPDLQARLQFAQTPEGRQKAAALIRGRDPVRHGLDVPPAKDHAPDARSEIGFPPMTHDPHQVEAALAHLIGLPLWATRRAGDMQGFHFGAQHTRVARIGSCTGEPVTYGELALHVQCAWHISSPEGLYVASGDLYEKSTAAKDALDDEWDWSAAGSNRRDELLTEWLTAKTYVVTACSADACGGFSLVLAEGYQLNVFPDVSGDHECWRMLFNLEERDHFVVLGKGIER